MKKINQWVVFALGIGALALALLVGSAPNVGAAPGPSLVEVLNTPLPVTGTVDLAGTPTVRMASNQIFRFFTDGSLGPSPPLSFVNNTNRLIVIEDVTGIDGAGYFSLDLSPSPNAEFVRYYFAGTLINSFQYHYHDVVKIYVLPGEKVEINSNSAGDYTLTGHYQPAP